MPSLRAAMEGRRRRVVVDGDEGITNTTNQGTSTTTATTPLLSLFRAKTESEEKVEWVRSQLIGRGAAFDTPFGRRPLVYADHTASGRSLRYVEDYILHHVLPFYGNTHTEDSYVGSRTTRTVRRAESYIKKCLGAGDNDALLFCGSGATAAIKRLQEVMGVAASPGPLRERAAALLRPEERWVVFVGPYEHHSNLLSWRRSLADVVEIGEDGDGLLDLAALRQALRDPRYADRPMIGSFSACSNVTGIITDTRAVARLLHQHGAFACFDFAASGPYVEIDMRSDQTDGYDAVFLSPHKFVGGAAGTPGILAVTRALYRISSQPPTTCGGGTVLYANGASESHTVYHSAVEAREDAGTPPIVGKVRAALAFWVKHRAGLSPAAAIREWGYADAAMAWLMENPRVVVLGNVKARRLPIFSFLVFPGSDGGDDWVNGVDGVNGGGSRRRLPLHGRFVARLMNDLFGIQARGGCACAGPYGHRLLGVGDELSLRIRDAILKGYHGVKPGWTRVSFAYYLSSEELRYILAAVDIVAAHGHRFLPLYAFDWRTGDWRFRHDANLNRHHLMAHHLGGGGGGATTSSSEYSDDFDDAGGGEVHTARSDDVSAEKFEGYLETARRIARSLPEPEMNDRLVNVPEGVDPDIVLFRL
uniref:Aminotransferase class V domain-containing protein n=1 Tax=Leersia perrieri TaxID=77586 RepID=A0A0D9XQA0_9ORYZ